MPRFAYALPCDPQRAPEWRATAQRLLGQGAKAHRSFLLDRGIFRERVWAQTGTGTPPLTMFLWDCDDVDAATRRPTRAGGDHERWLFDTVIGDFHGQDVATFAFPEPEVLSGTTTMATAAAGTQTMFALPVPAEGIAAVRQLIGRIEQGDLAGVHSAFLTDASIHEEWIWLQEARVDLPALLLMHWIGDDLSGAWDRLTHVGEDPYARVLRDALFTVVVGLAPGIVAGWDIDQLLAMHVRRTDSEEPSARHLASRIVGWLARRRWDLLERVCLPEVAVHGSGSGFQIVGAHELVRLIAQTLPDGPPTVTDTLVSDQQVLCIIEEVDSGSATGLLFEVRAGLVTSLRVLPDWPTARALWTAAAAPPVGTATIGSRGP